MEAKAIVRYVRITPRKANQILELIRGKDVESAVTILHFTPKNGARIAEKLLKSAVANAENNFELDPGDLRISRAVVDEGPTIKRYRPRAQVLRTRFSPDRFMPSTFFTRLSTTYGPFLTERAIYFFLRRTIHLLDALLRRVL